MALNTEVANLAIAHLGTAQTIADIDTERSTEADMCRKFYEIAFNKTLRAFPWSFATKTAALNLVEEDPNDEWGYSYRYPSDCLFVRRVIGLSRDDSNNERIPYKIEQDDSGKLIFTDLENAEIEYSKIITDYTIIPEDFIMAFSYLLAFYIAPTVTKGDPFKLGVAAKSNFEEEISKAKAASVNEQQLDRQRESEFVRSRS